MPLNNKPLSDEALEAYEAQRDIGADLIQAIAEMKAGQGHKQPSGAACALLAIASMNPDAVLAEEGK